MNRNGLVVLRGGGDLATGVAQKIFRSGFKLLILEASKPTAIRRTVALCEAVYDGRKTVEDITARRIATPCEIEACHKAGEIPILVDPAGESLNALRPMAVVDAILAKRNLGTTKQMAPITIGLGPGFCAPNEVDIVIETMRGHDLGRLIFNGSARKNTGVPGEIGGQSIKRVIYAPVQGQCQALCQIGDIVPAGAPVLKVDDVVVPAPFTGMVRGLLRSGLAVHEGMKIADIDPRTNVDVHTISDKARCLGGAVLEALLYLKMQLSP